MKKNWLFRGFVGDEILPSYVGIVAKHDKNPVLKQPVSQWKVRPVFFRSSYDDPDLAPIELFMQFSVKSRVHNFVIGSRHPRHAHTYAINPQVYPHSYPSQPESFAVPKSRNTDT